MNRGWLLAALVLQTDLPARYEVNDLFTKIVDNRGEGEERLYGVRNARVLFRNVLRGGANNAYHRDHRRENQNPLPNDGLKHLCEEGFTDAIYLYPKNFKTAPRETECTRSDGSAGKLVYHNLIYNSDQDQILKKLRERLISGEGAVYLHCWNGWHASGYISAISLIQFCGMSTEDAVDYWNRNTDGVNQGENYDRIRKKIRAFRPKSELELDAETRNRACIIK
jgi:hypothetical protein